MVKYYQISARRLQRNDYRGKILVKYYGASSPFKYLMARKQVKSLLTTIKKRFLKQGIPFGCINDKLQYGVPETKEEYEYLCIRGYKFWKGIKRNMSIIANAGVKQGVLKIKASHDSYPRPLLDKGDK